MNDSATRAIIRARAIARTKRERQQISLLSENDLHHETIRRKLDGLFETNQFWNFSKCGRESLFRTCRDCGEVHEFAYRCSLKWCPRCQWFITERRRERLAAWAKTIKQPKHLVLTQRNFPILTASVIKQHTKNLAAMRRTYAMRHVRGGSVSVEITNEENGWHLHSHWLVDVDWLEMPEISKAWGHLVGQSFAIVKIKDARAADYLREVTKYVAEGSELAKWDGNQLNEFVSAIRGKRFFFPFGTLFQAGKAIRAEILANKPPQSPCDCGSVDFTYETEEQATLNEIRKMERSGRKQKPGRKPRILPEIPPQLGGADTTKEFVGL